MNGVVIAETLRRHFTSIAFWSFMALFAMISLGTGNMDANRSWPALTFALAIVTGAGVIGPEFSSGTLQLILVKPVNRAVYLLSRVAGVVALCIVAAIGAVGEAAGAAINGRTPQWTGMGIAYLNSFADSLFIVSLLALLGSFTRAYYNVGLWFGLQMLLLLFISIGTSKFPTPVLNAFRWVQNNLYPNTPSRFDRDWLLLVLSNAAIALVLACLAFRSREVPYGTD